MSERLVEGDVPAPPTAGVTIGIAVGLPEPFATELQTYRERLGDPDSRLIAPHITLVAPIELTPVEVVAVDEHLAGVAARHAPFPIALGGTGTFRPVTNVVFVQVIEGGHRCAQLAGDVRAELLQRDTDFPYHPHVTIAHHLADPALDAAEEALADYTARFTAWGFTRYERDGDMHWRPRRDFAFGKRLVE